ncbi:hypothetical protein P8H27_01995 [Pseudomonas sp. sp1636]|uniref:hypothetical protein n=1 Tax=Pseudomonas sp. sp1636 TaxID=3036707 RepID=UPI0025A4F20A|nr:hypothetical protein [Pseudomonas sp. sp1636]MDM8347671.1 hypothetical protein [Pseudomonas sp. sp1636]
MLARIFLMLSITAFLGCSKQEETTPPNIGSRFVGEWQKEGAQIYVKIDDDGGHYLIRQIYNGKVIATNIGEVVEDHLRTSQTGLGDKIFYSKTEDAIIFDGSFDGSIVLHRKSP